MFHELSAPMRDGAPEGRDWTTWADDGLIIFYLQSDGNNKLIDVRFVDDTKDIYFDSEMECHHAMVQYYTKHNKQYPYVDRLVELGATLTFGGFAIEQSIKSTIIQSEEMKF